MLKIDNLLGSYKIKDLITNRYILTLVIFVAWILFIDNNNLVSIYKLNRTIDQLKVDRDYYQEELAALDDDLYEIEEERERYARETFYLHKENEIVYLIQK